MRIRSRSAALTALSTAAVLALSACGESAAGAGAGGSEGGNPDTLVLAAVPSEESTSIEQQYEHVIAAIEAETGKEVEMQNATDYAAVIEAQRAGQVQLAAYGPFSYTSAVDSGVGSDILGVAIEEEGAEPGYKSYGIVPEGSDITSLEDYAGKNVCFVDPTSTSGYLYPSAGLIEAGIDPEADIEATFAGGHDASALAVADGTCDAGFAMESMVDTTLPDSGQLAGGDLVKVWESEVIAGSPVVASDTLDEELRTQLAELFETRINVPALVEAGICDDEESCVLPEESWGYAPAEDDYYDGVRSVCEVTESESCVS
ncbi:phosphate/phosphite/phosphonate ABC transporter substrate-binding protein [Brevibacterium album]|uniref:phosphate/phosphite/phosphonate ABC transporter substrate-binding protein n=1 Tax=Brevibacterium album TaxID=417948 RepID=UPI0003FA5D2A|nr:phosphate/phosphite/phosphonate ABC transporter substrate-binding protein [Brevibacterium album]